jgi:hypothetical protein
LESLVSICVVAAALGGLWVIAGIGFIMALLVLALGLRTFTSFRLSNNEIAIATSLIVDQILAIEDENARAAAGLERAIDARRPFVLMLRSYDLELSDIRTSGAEVHPALRLALGVDVSMSISTRSTNLEETAEDRLSETLRPHVYVVRMRDLGNPVIVRADLPRLCLPSNIWKDAVRELIHLAPIIVVHLVSLTRGVQFELDTILESGRQDSTVVVICDPQEFHVATNPFHAPDGLWGIRMYDYQPVDITNDVLRSFPRIINAGDIDYHNLDKSSAFRGWIPQSWPKEDS